MSTDSVLSFPRLDATNYPVWAQRMEYLLVHRGLWAAVEKEEHANSAKALALIGLHVEDAYLSTLAKCDGAHDAWETLKAVFQAKSNARKLQLRRELNSVKMSYDESLAGYGGRIKDIINQLAAAGYTVADEEAVWSMMAGLTDYYTPVVAALEVSDATYTIDEALAKLMPAEARRKLDFGGDTEMTARTDHGKAYFTSNERKGNVECWKCHKKGHIKRYCPENMKEGVKRVVAW